jgi:hypothetical protein
MALGTYPQLPISAGLLVRDLWWTWRPRIWNLVWHDLLAWRNAQKLIIVIRCLISIFVFV